MERNVWVKFIGVERDGIKSLGWRVCFMEEEEGFIENFEFYISWCFYEVGGEGLC